MNSFLLGRGLTSTHCNVKRAKEDLTFTSYLDCLFKAHFIFKEEEQYPGGGWIVGMTREALANLDRLLAAVANRA